METMRSSQAVKDVYGVSEIDNIFCQEKKDYMASFEVNCFFFNEN